MNIISNAFRVLLLVVISQQMGFTQTTATITASSNTTICSGQCANLSSTVVPVNATNTYTVGSTAYTPFAFSGGTPAVGTLLDDFYSAPINIGFNFCYFGNTFNQLLISTNGEITFNLTGIGVDYNINNILPNTIEHRGNAICGVYRDIDPSDAASSVNYYVVGTAPNRAFVAYW